MHRTRVALMAGLVGLGACASVTWARQEPPEAKPVPTHGLPLSQARRTSMLLGKPILIVFGASWCGWCKRLDGLLEKEPFKKAIEWNYILVHLNVLEPDDKKSKLEKPGAAAFLKECGGAGQGLPFYVVLDPGFKKIADSNGMPGNKNIGYPATPEEIVAFEAFLKKTASRLSADELATLVEHLKKVAPKQQD